MTIDIQKLFIALTVLTVLNSRFSAAQAQGALTPSGAPAPTMKSLDQIEPRTIVNAVNTPGDAADLFVITNSGSYYLATNLVGVSAKNGILISASHVTLDLNGFALIGVTGSSDGVGFAGIPVDVTIKNGTICNWGGNGVNATLASNSQFEDLNVSKSGNYGLYVGAASRVSRCVVQGSGSHGIYVGAGVLVEGCASSYNAGSGIVNYNFYLQIPNVLITGCSVMGNQSSGIVGTEDIVGNVCSGNAGAGIFLFGYGGRADGNHVIQNGTGISLGGSSSTNLVIRNFLSGNTNGAVVIMGLGNIVGPLITTTGILTNSNPWANFSF